MKPRVKNFLKIFGLVILVILGWYIFFYAPPTQGDWQTHLAVQSRAEFNNNLVTIKNVRDFRYFPTESDIHINYYDQTYDLNKLVRVWYVTEPFQGQTYAAHTFLSFEFSDSKFVTITIEARKTKAQEYKVWLGMIRSYPLIYIAADERDTIRLRADVRKDEVFVYPVKTTSENAVKLFVDMLTRMNELQHKPVWYHTLFSNCTTNIVYHVNRVSPKRVPFSWKLWLTGYADELAYDLGLLDTPLSLVDARKRYKINDLSKTAPDTSAYSTYIRQSGYAGEKSN